MKKKWIAIAAVAALLGGSAWAARLALHDPAAGIVRVTQDVKGLMVATLADWFPSTEPSNGVATLAGILMIGLIFLKSRGK